MVPIVGKMTAVVQPLKVAVVLARIYDVNRFVTARKSILNER